MGQARAVIFRGEQQRLALQFALVQIVTFALFALGVYLAIRVAARAVLPTADAQLIIRVRDVFVSELRGWCASFPWCCSCVSL